MEAALALGDKSSADGFVSSVEAWRPGQVSPFMHAQTERFRARLSPDSSEADGRFKAAAGLFREIGTPFFLACTLLEHGERLVSGGRSNEAKPLLDEAREIFDRLEATPWLERLNRVAPDLART